MRLYTSKVVAQWLCLTERRVRQLRDEGVNEEYKPGLYDLQPTVLRYIRYVGGAGKESPYTSESFGGYSYTKATDANGAPIGWQKAFASRLNKWRKL